MKKAREKVTTRDSTGSWCVYRVWSDLCPKLYVGMTGNLERRWREHRTKANGDHSKLLYQAMRKVGVDSFRIEKLTDCPDRDTACLAEKYWIGHLGTIAPYGLNERNGVDGVATRYPGRPDWDHREWYGEVWDGWRTEVVWRYGIEFKAAPGSRAQKQGKLWFSRGGQRLDHWTTSSDCEAPSRCEVGRFECQDPFSYDLTPPGVFNDSSRPVRLHPAELAFRARSRE